MKTRIYNYFDEMEDTHSKEFAELVRFLDIYKTQGKESFNKANYKFGNNLYEMEIDLHKETVELQYLTTNVPCHNIQVPMSEFAELLKKYLESKDYKIDFIHKN